jgi:hypothetical protein
MASPQELNDELPLDPADRVVEGLLSELLGQSPPPDLTAQILQRWARDDRPSTVKFPIERRAPRHRRWSLAVAGIAASAASLGLVVWAFRDSGGGPSVAERQTPPASLAAAGSQPSSNRPPVAPPSSDPAIVAGPPIRLDTSDVPFANADGSLAKTVVAPRLEATAPSVAAHPRPSRLSSEQIVAELDQRLSKLWGQRSIQPAEEVDPATFVDRLHRSLIGEPASIGDRDSLLQLLNTEGPLAVATKLVATPEASIHVGDRLAEIMVGRASWVQLSADRRQEVAKAMLPLALGETTYDRFLSEALAARGDTDPKSPNYNRNMQLLAAWNSPNSILATERVARLCFARNIGCAQCHDDQEISGVDQRSYWSLNALVQRDLRWRTNGGFLERVASAGDPASSVAVFFESLDGRQQIADPTGVGVLLGEDLSQVQPIDQLVAAADLQGILGNAAADVAWQFLFDRALFDDPNTSDSDAGQADLAAVRTLLSEQLRAYDYHLPTAVGWLISSRAYRLAESVDETPSSGSSATQAIAVTRARQQAWATFQGPQKRRSLETLLKLAELWKTGSFAQNDERTLLGQLAPRAMQSALPAAGNGVATNGATKTTEDPLTADQEAEERSLRGTFRRTGSGELPLAWLASLENRGGFESQVRHLYAWAGIRQTSPDQMRAAERIRNSCDGDSREALLILHWAIDESGLSSQP